MLREFIPKSYSCLKSGYSLSAFRADLLAGITVGIIALPLAMAFGIASGVTPEKGLFTAIIAGFLISALGGSRVQIGGPTGAFVVVVADIIQRTGYDGLAISTLIASCILVLLGVFRLGSYIKYVPHSLTTGFTTGIAVIIFSSQIKDLFGLKIGVLPVDFVKKWGAYAQALPNLDLTTTFLGLGTLSLILIIRRFYPRLPWGISAIVFATASTYFFEFPVETIQSKFGRLPANLPAPSLPPFFVLEGRFHEIFSDAITIACLGAIESLLSAVIGDGMIGGRHRSNCELIAQGIANFCSILFGGIPATGAIARTAANVKNGATTPVSGMTHALTLCAFLFLFSPLVGYIPLAALAAVLIMVAWNMSELHHFIALLRAPIGDRVVLLTAFSLTIFVDITVAITFGMILASFFFLKRMSEISKAVPMKKVLRGSNEEECESQGNKKKEIPQDIEVYELQGPFFFGTAHILRDFLADFTVHPRVFILDLGQVPFVDASGIYALTEFHERCRKSQIRLILCGVQQSVANELKRSGLYDLIGGGQIYREFDRALESTSPERNG
jgi:sulfate permease, SulP family